MIKTLLSTGALLSVDRRSLTTACYSSLAFIYCVLFVTHSAFRGRGRTSSPILGLFTGVTCYHDTDPCKSRIMSVNC